MDDYCLTDAYDRHKGQERPAADDQGGTALVNYIWLRAKGGLDNSQSVFGIRLRDLDIALDNAQRYPDAAFNIWLDRDDLSEMDMLYLADHETPFNLPNVHVKFIHELEGHAEDDLLEYSTHIAIRSDWARLRVIDHCFQTTDHRDIFYADFDCADVRLTSPLHLDALAECGLVAGMFKNADHGGDEYENGYMGFRRGFGEEFLRHKIIPDSQEFMEDGSDGATPFIMAVGEMVEVSGVTTTLGERLLEPCGYEVPDTPIRNAGLIPRVV